MRTIALALAATLIGSAAIAETTVIHKETPYGDSTVVKRDSPDVTVTKKSVETTGAVGGCDTKSVTRTNELGDTSTKTKTEC